jgi:hypothetical protein
MEIAVRNVDENSWREFKATATKKGLPLGLALNVAIREWTEHKKNKNKDFFALKAVKMASQSSEIDEVLYG